MGVVGPATSSAAEPISRALRPPEQRSEACLNCGAALTGQFCAACGQRDIPPYPSVRELVVDAFWELSGWDGRFAATVRALFRRPGELTRAFLEGRRARYLSPLRLYLMTSLVYFLVAAAMPKPTPTSVTVDVGGVRVSATQSTPQRVAEAVITATQSQQGPDSAKREASLRDIAKAPAVFRPFLRRMILDPVGFRRGLVEAMPRVLFVLVPVFAGIVALFYHRRKYPEHLYFAIHFHSFVFLALVLSALARAAGIPVVSTAVRFAVFVWIPVYATLSFRRLYGGSTTVTLLKEAGIGTLYVGASLVALIGTIYWVALWG